MLVDNKILEDYELLFLVDPYAKGFADLYGSLCNFGFGFEGFVYLELPFWNLYGKSDFELRYY
jgi:hypothetical protein